MRFSIQLPTDRVDAGAEFVCGEAVAEMARCAETAGFAAAFVTDHPFPGDAWLAAGGHHTLDPFVALSFAAAATTRLRLQTHVLVLGYRSPFLTAKAAASLDALSGGRLVLGVAGGYLESEFRALGADFAGRHARVEEWVPWIRRAWAEAGLCGAGPGFELAGNTMLPRPAQQPGPPIWIGGNSRAAIRRAVEHGDGWLPFPVGRRMARAVRTAPLAGVGDLRARVAYARDHARAVGRAAPLEIAFAPSGLDPRKAPGFDAARVLEEARELSQLGVGWLTISLPGGTRAEWREGVRAFGERVIARAG